MLHTKFRGNWPTGSGEEDFVVVFTIYGRGGHHGHVTWILRSNFRLPYQWMLHIKFQLDGPAVSEKKIFEKCVWTTDWPRSRDDLDLI